ncbi:F-box/kelch-repeat protein At3g23880-like [Vigna umbellata]|uniref:F-box/kelch-repeat protein At3g23880-like n=1 Tax=Vigna umbellata TaxID=87088 RepID=UPI001F5ED8D6|nr:F-box/kelch-repeat protein At3g23880-like [Vigna umbellata]
MLHAEQWKKSKMKRYGRRGVRRRNITTVLLPRDLIIKVLLRLPVKSLVRFKSVCKSWFSLISDPHFAISHFELAAACTERLLLLESSVPEVRSIDFNAPLHDDSASATLNLNFLPPESFGGELMGSCRGFVLSCGLSLCLWNPSTGIHKQVCPSPIASMDAMFFPFLYGFGYDPSTDDYLVVQASYDVDLEPATRVEFFSVRANAWKEIEGIHLCYMNCGDEARTGSLLNGAIHWLACRYDVSTTVIVAFDLTERSFSEILLPEDLACQFDFCNLGVLGGFLCVHVVGYEECPAEIWVMKEYKIQSSWSKSVAVVVDEIPGYFSLICSTKSGDIVGTDGSQGLVKYNSEGELLEHRSYYDVRGGLQMIVYNESLLSLSYDSDQAEED